ncbi:cadherin-related family member 3-like [Tenrec ecaudatus]|uniref:cadherin-related family member 3-like n=1 Tax=Tenrec ecaudatus TaxID=94439 RepID=UPI003F5932A0
MDSLPQAPDVAAVFHFNIQNASPLLENASDHTQVAIITASFSHHASLVGDPVIINANPTVHPFVLSPKATNRWELDFETVALYSLVIYAKDNQGATASQTIAIQIADVNEPPAFTGSLSQSDQVAEIYILEDTAPGTVIYRAAAKDPEDAVLEYFISPEDSGFTIDSIGTVSTAAVFDFESTVKSFSLVMKALDPGGLFAVGNVKVFLINVNSKDPILTCSSTLHNKVDITLDEEIPIGKTIGQCQATDEDNLGELTFELDPGSVYFTVDKEHGTVITTARLDVERAGFVSIQSFSIRACDQDRRCAAIPVTAYIHGINDNAPFCDQYLIRYKGKEVIAKDVVVARLSCHDVDEPPDILHYAPSSGPIGSGQLFEQVPNAAHLIQVIIHMSFQLLQIYGYRANPQTVARDLDYENPEMVSAGHIYVMMVSVFDDLHPSHTATVTVIVEITSTNDFSPVFKPAHYTFSVPETSGAYYKVGRVTAIDEDHPPNCVTYQITNGDVQVIQRFWIHPFTGMIELTTQPDYESVKQYNLTVEAVDCDRFQPHTAVTVVTVDIEDENDEAPVCTPRLHKAVISDNVVAGTSIHGFQLHCHDRDSEDFEMRFEIVSGNKNHHFGFDPTRGSNTPRLIVTHPFAFESGLDLQRQYHLVVHIIDDNLKSGKAAKPRTGTAMIDIYVARASTPPPPTTSSEQKQGLTIVYTAINTYKASDWYIPFIFTLMAVFCAGLAAWVSFLLWRYSNVKQCCPKLARKASRSQAQGLKYIAGDRHQKEMFVTGNGKKKLEVLTETIVYETVFDGEAIDPVSGNVYQYNSRTGARKWKKAPRPQEEDLENMYSLPVTQHAGESTSSNTPVQG